MICECGKTINTCEHDHVIITDTTGVFVFHGDKIANYSDMNIIIGSFFDLDSKNAYTVYEQIRERMTIRDLYDVCREVK